MEKKTLNMKVLGAIAAVVVVAIVLIVVFVLNKGNDMTAIVMRLMHSEGTVSLMDDTGKEKSLIEDMNFYSGYKLITGADGEVKISMDDTRLVTLDNNSKMGFEKEDKSLRINLEEGQLYFNVKEKLAEDETFEIETSTMVVGIRGTSGLVKADEIIVTDGEVEVTGTNKVTGGQKSITIGPGQKLIVKLDNTKEGEDSVDLIIGEAPLDQLPEIALREIAEDSDLAERVAAAYDMSVEDLQKEVTTLIEEASSKTDFDNTNNDTNSDSDSTDSSDGNTTDNTTTGDGNNQTNTTTTTTTTTNTNTTTTDSDTNTNTEDTSNENTETKTYAVSLTLSDSEGGSVKCDVSKAKEGDTVTIKATANDGYEFTKWTVVKGDVTLKNAKKAKTTFTMGAKAVKVKAHFTKTTTDTTSDTTSTTSETSETTEEASYSITVSSNDTNLGAVSVSATTAKAGETITLTATPVKKWYDNVENSSLVAGTGVFTGWSVTEGGASVSSTSPSVAAVTSTFTMPAANVTITGNFANTHMVSYTAMAESGGKDSYGGTLSVSSLLAGSEIQNMSMANVLAYEGETVTVSATPLDAYTFAKWYEESSLVTPAAATSASTTFTMGSSELNMVAYFERKIVARTVEIPVVESCYISYNDDMNVYEVSSADIYEEVTLQSGTTFVGNRYPFTYETDSEGTSADYIVNRITTTVYVYADTEELIYMLNKSGSQCNFVDASVDENIQRIQSSMQLGEIQGALLYTDSDGISYYLIYDKSTSEYSVASS